MGGSVRKARSDPIPPATGDRDTTHQFRSVEEVLDETQSGQPIGECRVAERIDTVPLPLLSDSAELMLVRHDGDRSYYSF